MSAAFPISAKLAEAEDRKRGDQTVFSPVGVIMKSLADATGEGGALVTSRYRLSSLNERKNIGVDEIRVCGRHAVRQARVDLQR